MATNILSILSYNVGSSGTLAGLKQLLEMHKPDLVFLQEVTISTEQLKTHLGWKYDGISNIDQYDQKKPGTACIWLSSLQVVVNNILSCRLQTLNYADVKYINVYAPSGTQKQRARRELFGGGLLNEIVSRTRSKLPVLLGDWNCVLRPQDISDHVAGNLQGTLENNGSGSNFQQKRSKELTNIVKSFHYQDIFIRFHDKVDFTWARPGCRPSRLDRIYMPLGLASRNHWRKVKLR